MIARVQGRITKIQTKLVSSKGDEDVLLTSVTIESAGISPEAVGQLCEAQRDGLIGLAFEAIQVGMPFKTRGQAGKD